MQGYTKLFSSILASSVWGESKETKIVWITMLAMADKFGVVDAAIPGLAKFAGLTIAETQLAVEVLSSPDTFSRTKEFEGRRIEPLESGGGWSILNHAKYRAKMGQDERRAYLAQKQAERRARLKAVNTVSTPVNTGSEMLSLSTHADSDSEADADSEAESIYELYPRKTGRKDAIKAIRFALQSQTAVKLKDRTAAFAAATAFWHDKQFIPHPATWFNRGSYDDDPETWVRGQSRKDRTPGPAWRDDK